MKKTDSIYLKDILTSINKVNKFVTKLTFQDFQLDNKTQFAVFHAFEVIGEVANRLSPEFLQNYPEFPVRQAVEMRNLLIHGYDQINLDIVWKTITDNLPVLKKQVKEIIS